MFAVSIRNFRCPNAGIRANTTPLSTASVGVGQPTRFVLEVPGGYAARRGIAPGDQIELLEIASH